MDKTHEHPRRRSTDRRSIDAELMEKRLGEMRDMTIATAAGLKTHLETCEVKADLQIEKHHATHQRIEAMERAKAARDAVVDGRFAEIKASVDSTNKTVVRVGIAIVLLAISTIGTVLTSQLRGPPALAGVSQAQR